MSSVTGPAQAIRIETIEGPIGTELLQAISGLYGREVDERYSDVDFTRRVFNENPAGRSYHTFALHNNEAVGCYAVIPVKVLSRGRQLWAGKGEALYVREQYRGAGLFLIQRGIRFASECGLELQFGLTDSLAAGKVLQSMGFRVISGAVSRRLRLLPGDISNLSPSRAKLLAARGLRTAQTIVGSAAAGLLRHGTPVHVNNPEHVGAVLAHISHRYETLNTRWSVAADEESLLWWNSIGRLDVITVDGDPHQFVTVFRAAPGGDAEIFCCAADQGLPGAFALLQRAVEKAKQERAVVLSLRSDADLSPHREITRAATLLGFYPGRAQPIVYVKAADPFFISASNLVYTGLLSI